MKKTQKTTDTYLPDIPDWEQQYRCTEQWHPPRMCSFPQKNWTCHLGGWGKAPRNPSTGNQFLHPWPGNCAEQVRKIDVTVLIHEQLNRFGRLVKETHPNFIWSDPSRCHTIQPKLMGYGQVRVKQFIISRMSLIHCWGAHHLTCEGELQSQQQQKKLNG